MGAGGMDQYNKKSTLLPAPRFINGAINFEILKNDGTFFNVFQRLKVSVEAVRRFKAYMNA